MKVLMVCTGNSCRSVLAAACLRALRPDWHVASGGIRPEAATSTLTQQELRACHLAVPAEAPKHWQDAGKPAGIKIENWDVIIALSPEAIAVLEQAVQNAPLLLWPMADPMAVKGTEAQKVGAYRHARQVLQARLADWLEAGMPGIRRREA